MSIEQEMDIANRDRILVALDELYGRKRDVTLGVSFHMSI